MTNLPDFCIVATFKRCVWKVNDILIIILQVTAMLVGLFALVALDGRRRLPSTRLIADLILECISEPMFHPLSHTA